LLYITGTSDILVKFGGGTSPLTGNVLPAALDVLDAWVSNNGCDTNPTVTPLPNVNTTDRSTVELSQFGGCDSYASADGEVEAEVSFYKVIGGGHRWPGGLAPPPTDHQALAPTNHDINASEVIWDFFSRHTLPQRSTTSVCDFDGNSSCDLADIDAMTAAIFQGSPDMRFDLNGDSSIDQFDIAPWLASAATDNGFGEPYLPGDSNLDGSVDATDLNNLALNWRQSVTQWSGGDFKVDGFVDPGDLNALALNWRQSIPVAEANAAVPEPSAWLLTVVGLALLWRRPRRS
jgi:hypothetical protein